MSVYTDAAGAVVLRCDSPVCPKRADTQMATDTAARLAVRALGWVSRYRGGALRWDYCADHAAGHPPSRRDREGDR